MIRVLFLVLVGLNLLWSFVAFRGGPLPLLGIESPGGVGAGLLWFGLAYPMSALGLPALVVAGLDLFDRVTARRPGTVAACDWAHELVDEGTPLRGVRSSGRCELLTGVLDREGLLVRLEAERGPLVIALVELDRLATVERRHGRLAAEQLLADVGGRLRRGAGDGLVARWSEDGFVLVLTGRDPDESVGAIRRLLDDARADGAGDEVRLSAALAAARDGREVAGAVGLAEEVLRRAEPRLLVAAAR